MPMDVGTARRNNSGTLCVGVGVGVVEDQRRWHYRRGLGGGQWHGISEEGAARAMSKGAGVWHGRGHGT